MENELLKRRWLIDDHSIQDIIPLPFTNTLNMSSSSSQIYVEIERARLTKTLANIKEQSGEVKEAASILQELQVSDRCPLFSSFKDEKKKL